MRLRTRVLPAVVLALLAAGRLVAEEASGVVWQSDNAVRPAGVVFSPPDRLAFRVQAADGVMPLPPVGEWRKAGENRPAMEPPTRPVTEGAGAKTMPPAAPRPLPREPAYKAEQPQPRSASANGQAAGAAPGNSEAAKYPDPSAALPIAAPAERSPCDFCGDWRCDGSCPRARRAATYGGSDGEPDEAEKPSRLFDPPALRSRGISLYGWVDQGFTFNASNPADRFNGPVAYNDRSDEYQLNQFYVVIERTTSTEKQDWDLGGRVDLLYGTDSRFAVARGLETTWNTGQRFYGLALPQMYGDVAFRDWVIRFGHFYTIRGNEVVPAPDNFFYSHSYSFLYAEPITHTGMLAKWQLNDRFSLSGGLIEGWDQWVSANQKLGFLGGANWTSESKWTSVAWAISLCNQQDPGIASTRTLSTLVVSQKLDEKWKYTFQNDYGYETNIAGGGAAASWYSFVNYLVYDVTDSWSLGARYEWLSDRDGTRVRGLGMEDGLLKGIPLGASPSQWQEISIGVNYKPGPNLLVRSELRWDWAAPIGGASFVDSNGTPVAGPFDDFTKIHQFLWGTDVIVKF